MRLPLVLLTVGKNIIHSDALALSRVLSIYKFAGHTKSEKKAALRIRKKVMQAHEAQLSSIDLDDDQEDVLRKVVESPHEHLLETVPQGEKRVDGYKRVLEEPLVIASMISLEMFLDGEASLYEDEAPMREVGVV